MNNTAEFLNLLYGHAPPGHLPLWTLPDKETHWFLAADLERAADTAVKLSNDYDVYFGIGLQPNDLGPQKRGEAKDVIAVPGLWADIDIQSAAHRQLNLPPTLDDALDLAQQFPLLPTVVVHSGHGLQAWWLFPELWKFGSEDEWIDAQALAHQFQKTLAAAAQARGWKMDITSDLARVLRLPGTFNRKLEPVEVRIIQWHETRRYDPSEFEPYLLKQNQGFNKCHITPDDAPEDKAATTVDLLAPHWDDGLRHMLAISLSGFLANVRVPEATCVDIVESIAELADDPELEDRVRAVRDTYRKLESGERILGIAGLEEHLPSNVVSRLKVLWGTRHRADRTSAAAQFPQTDLGNAKRLVARHGENIRYCAIWRKWLYWDGRRWVIDETGHVVERAKETAEALLIEAIHAGDKHAIGHAVLSQSVSRIKAMIELAQSEPEIAIQPKDLDSDVWLLNCLNGTVDLRTGDLRSPSRGDLITKLAPVDYDPDAPCPTWNGFLQRVTRNNPELIEFLQRTVGYALTGDTSEQCLFILHGAGANGKTTFMEAVRSALGDYAQQAEFSTFLERRSDGPRNDVARLKGARFVSAVEVGSNRRLDEAQVKQMTGGDTVTARFLYAEYFEYEPTYKIFLAANHKPTIRGTDNAIWRRIRLIPFVVTIPEGERDKQLPQRLRGELAGILAWAVRGCVNWQREGLAVPEEVKRATEDYREEMDSLAGFLEDCVVAQGSGKVAKDELFKAYEKWCERNGEEAFGKTLFGKLMKERFSDAKSGSTRYWKGIALRNQTEPMTNLEAASVEREMVAPALVDDL
jgi:P4 family phage/plasmid primase-like protien